MKLYLHELKMNRISFLIWLLSVLAFSGGCILLFPGVKDSMTEMSDAFAEMGGFSAAFGMDKLSIATLEGFFGTEIGTIYALGGGMFAALTGITALAKEEGGHTAEFLCTLPLGRVSIVTSKLASVVSCVTLFGLLSFGAFAGLSNLIGETLDAKVLFSYMLAQYLCQLEVASICFAVSAAAKRNSFGLGLGIALVLYVVDIVSRITDKMDFLKYVTPFSFSNATDVFCSEGSLDVTMTAISVCVTVICAAAAYILYGRKDIAA